mmetsp:Transcript_135371/g.234791  ORF Transcript_135371/g.234791 Transcript_135371/m.234791 type:complete len:83 (-) Transcript_135371:2-250(-)
MTFQPSQTDLSPLKTPACYSPPASPGLPVQQCTQRDMQRWLPIPDHSMILGFGLRHTGWPWLATWGPNFPSTPLGQALHAVG